MMMLTQNNNFLSSTTKNLKNHLPSKDHTVMINYDDLKSAKAKFNSKKKS